MLINMLLLLITALLVTHNEAVAPGLKAILSQRCLDYAAKESVAVLSKEAMGQSIPDQSGEAGTPVGKVKYSLTGMRVTSFGPPTSAVTIQPGLGATWHLQDASVTVHGDWKYEYKKIFKIRDHGSFDVSASGIGITLSVVVGEAAGKPTMQTTGCSSTVGSVSVKFHGGASWLYNLFDHYVEKAVKSSLQDTMCKAATKAVNVDLAQELANIKLVVDMGQLELDYSLVSAPLFQTNYMASFHKGEVFWAGDKTEAPFEPAPLPTVDNPQMLTLIISDYLVNSLCYVTQEHRLLEYNLTKDDLSDKDKEVLNTTCSGFECIGGILPAIKNKYPNASVELEMGSLSSPTLNIQPSQMAGNFFGYIDYYVRMNNGTRAFLFSTIMNVTMNLDAYIQDTIIKANVTSYRSNIIVTKSDVPGITTEVMNLIFKVIATTFVIPKLNEVGAKGLELPTVNNVQYINPSLKLLQGSLIIGTDLQYDPTLYFHQNKPRVSMMSLNRFGTLDQYPYRT